MRIVNIVPGFGGSFYCGNCLRDSAYTRSLQDSGHDAITLPIYLPLTLNGEQTSKFPVFYGAINIYLKQQFPFLRNMPKWMERMFNSAPLLKYAAKKSGSTRAEGLEEMTLSMLRGHQGYQKEELQQLIDFLKNDLKPDVVHLSNALLMGLARKIKDDLGIPVVCSLQDEDVWIDAMADSYQDQLWGMMTEKAKDVDLFIAVSDFFAKVMQPRMSISDEKLKVIYIGVDPYRFDVHEPNTDSPVVGFMSRMNVENGFEIFIDAYIKLKADPKYTKVKARVSGGMTGDDEKFINKQKAKLRKAQILQDVEFVEEYGEEYHNQFFQHVTMLSVPVLKGEAFGLYQIQSLACGVPLVQPELGAFPEIVRESEGGVIYSPNTPEALADKWKEILDNPEQLKEMARNGRQNTEEKFNSMKLINTMINAYESVINSTK